AVPREVVDVGLVPVKQRRALPSISVYAVAHTIRIVSPRGPQDQALAMTMVDARYASTEWSYRGFVRWTACSCCLTRHLLWYGDRPGVRESVVVAVSAHASLPFCVLRHYCIAFL